MRESTTPRDHDRLPPETARRVLARAGELEAEYGTEVTIAQLREAAREAGIAPAAFDRALAEVGGMHDVDRGSAVQRPRRLTPFWLSAILAGLLLLFFVALRIVP